MALQDLSDFVTVQDPSLQGGGTARGIRCEKSLSTGLRDSHHRVTKTRQHEPSRTQLSCRWRIRRRTLKVLAFYWLNVLMQHLPATYLRCSRTFVVTHRRGAHPSRNKMFWRVPDGFCLCCLVDLVLQKATFSSLLCCSLVSSCKWAYHIQIQLSLNVIYFL